MKTRKTFSLLLVLCALFALYTIEASAAVRSGTCGKDGSSVSWTLDNAGTLTISGTGEMADYSYSKSKDAPWYNYRGSVKHISVGSGVTHIGSDAFRGSAYLTDVRIANSVTSIGAGAFYKCSALTDITLPGGLTAISDNMFGECKVLRTINIPQSVTKIGASAFAFCNQLGNITIPNGVTEIGAWAFRACSSFTELTVPSSVVYIERNAFAACTKLETLTVPFVGGRELYESGEIVRGYMGFVFDGGNLDYKSFKSSSIPKSLKTIIVSEGCTVLKDGAFYDFSDVENIILPSTLRQIGNDAFCYCHSLRSITIPDSVQKVGSNAFYQCKALESMTLPFIGRDASSTMWSFGGGGSISYLFGAINDYNDIPAPGIPATLKSIHLTNACKRILRNAFYGCENVEQLTIGSGVETIEGLGVSDKFRSITVSADNPYYSSDSSGVLFNKDKTGLIRYPAGSTNTSYEIPDSVTSIGESAFRNCAQLLSVKLPDGLEKLGSNAFLNCPAVLPISNFEGAVVPSGAECLTALYSSDGQLLAVKPALMYDGKPGLFVPDALKGSVGTAKLFILNSATLRPVKEAVKKTY